MALANTQPCDQPRSEASGRTEPQLGTRGAGAAAPAIFGFLERGGHRSPLGRYASEASIRRQDESKSRRG